MEAGFEAEQGSALILSAQAGSTPAGSEDDGNQEKVAGKRMTAKHGGLKLAVALFCVEMVLGAYDCVRARFGSNLV